MLGKSDFIGKHRKLTFNHCIGADSEVAAWRILSEI
jgi:hypothetical protein